MTRLGCACFVVVAVANLQTCTNKSLGMYPQVLSTATLHVVSVQFMHCVAAYRPKARMCATSSSEQVCLASLNLLHTHLALASTRPNYYCYYQESAILTKCNWAGIRDHVVQSVELKFNCFFLMPVVDSFPTKLREELESAYDDDIDEVFDVTAVRNALESRLKALESELHQVSEQ